MSLDVKKHRFGQYIVILFYFGLSLGLSVLGPRVAGILMSCLGLAGALVLMVLAERRNAAAAELPSLEAAGVSQNHRDELFEELRRVERRIYEKLDMHGLVSPDAASDGLFSDTSSPEDVLQSLEARFFSPHWERRFQLYREAARVDEVYYLVPYLLRLLEIVTKKTEESAMGLMDRFMSIQTKSSDTALQAEDLISGLNGEANGSSLTLLTEDLRSHITQEEMIVRELSSCHGNTTGKIDELKDVVAKSTEMLTNIEDITSRSRLIGINLSIEASRFGGTAGQGIKVIVNELNRLNDRTSDFSKNITDRLKNIEETILSVQKDVATTMGGTILKITERSSVMQESFEKLVKSYETFSRLSKIISESTIGVNADLDGILEHLQFQDITRQEIETVQDTLSYMRNLIVGVGEYFAACGQPLESNAAAVERVTKELLSRVKVKEEREAITEVSYERSRG